MLYILKSPLSLCLFLKKRPLLSPFPSAEGERLRELLSASLSSILSLTPAPECEHVLGSSHSALGFPNCYKLCLHDVTLDLAFRFTNSLVLSSHLFLLVANPFAAAASSLLPSVLPTLSLFLLPSVL